MAANTVNIIDSGGSVRLDITEAPNNIVNVVGTETVSVTIAAVGPQGPQGSPGNLDLTSLVTTSSFNSFTSSYATGSFTGSLTGILFGTSSWALSSSRSVSSSYTTTSSYSETASFTENANNANLAVTSTNADSVYVTNLLYTNAAPQAPAVPLPLLTTKREGGYETDGYTSLYENSNVLLTNSNILTITGSGAQLRIGYEAPDPLGFPSPQFFGTIQVLGNVYADSYTGSLEGTASFSNTASYTLSSSYATTASYVISSSFATSASYSLSASYAVSASFSRTAITASNLTTGTYLITSSWANTASNANNQLIGNYSVIESISKLYPILVSPFDTTTELGYGAPYANTDLLFNPRINTLYHTGSDARVFIGSPGNTGARVVVYGKVSALDFNNSVNTLNFVTDIDREDSVVAALSVRSGSLFLSGSSYSGSFTGSLFGTSSWASKYNETDPVFVAKSASLATTGSNTFKGTQTFSGSLIITGDTTIYGSSSLVNVTASQLDVGTNTISVNVFEPLQRFGGFKVYDSGSSQATASLLWDSLNNGWIYQNVTGSTYSGGGLISGPRNTGSLGDETYPTQNRVVKGQGGDHITDSNITDTGTLVSINSNTHITGSLIVTAGITGSLFGTSSWASNSLTASSAPNYVLNSITSSMLLPYVLSSQTGSLTVLSSSFALTASQVTSASFATTALTASYWSGTLDQVNDVIDYTPATIVDGYLLGWVSGSQRWEPVAGATAKGSIRLFVSANKTNANAFHYNSITVTADSSANASATTAFMVTSTLLTKVTVHFRSDATPGSTRIDIYKNANGTPFANATSSIANATNTPTTNTISTYTFSGLTLNQFDSIHIKVTPTNSPGQTYAIVTIE